MDSLTSIFTDQCVRHCIDELKSVFSTAGIETASLDARLLVQYVCDIDHSQVIKTPERILSSNENEKLIEFTKRRLQGEPIARIFGKSEFWSLDFALSMDTLVPRPETETLIEQTIEFLDERREEKLRLIDIGTGSGCILLSLLTELPFAFGVGLDKNLNALWTARRNASSLRLNDRCDFVNADWLGAIAVQFDVIVSNPPYIRRKDIKSLPREVSLFDPHLALDGGEDGLDAYRIIFQQASELLAPKGILVVEFGDGQANDLIAVLNQSPLGERVDRSVIRLDIAGRERTLGIQVRE